MKLQTITGLVAGLVTAHLASASDLFAFEAAHALVNPSPGHRGALRASAVKLGSLKARDGVIHNRDNLLVARQGTCEIGYKRCDDGCIPLTGVCCGDGDGAYCKLGTYCQTDGCCETGKICSGPPGECESGYELCLTGCMPEGAVCCPSGYSCNAGETCTSDGYCEEGGSSGGGGGSGGGSATCDAGEEVCDSKCMPTGETCCKDGDGSYCSSGWLCTATGCRPEDSVDCKDGSYCEEGTLCDNVRDVCVNPSISISSASRTATSTRSLIIPTSTESEASIPTSTESENSVPTFPTLPRPSDTGNDDDEGDDDGGVGGSSTEETTPAEQAPPAETTTSTGGGSNGGSGAAERRMSLAKMLGLAALVPLFL